IGGSSCPRARFPRPASGRRQESRCYGSRWWAEAAKRASWTSERLQLLLGRLGAAVPRFGQTRDRGAEIARELGCGARGSLMGHAPNGSEHFAARNRLLLASGDFRLQVLLQTIHPGVAMNPRIAEERRVKAEEPLPEAGQLQQPGAFGHEQPDGELYRRHALHEPQLHEPLEKREVAFQGRPG